MRLVQAANYTNAGTVEFIVDRHGNFYFIEVNARIQVEHPVTEMVTGIDLIKAQIRVAAGEPLPFTQEDIRRTRRARSSAASTPRTRRRTSAPRRARSTGSSPPGGFGVRFDSHVHAGYTVSPHYDSMIGKLIVHQPTREEAIACMKRALTRAADRRGQDHRPACTWRSSTHPAFAEGRVDTTFIERTWPSSKSLDPEHRD